MANFKARKTKFYDEQLFFITKKLLFLITAEKRQITETAIFGGYGGKTAVGGANKYFYLCVVAQEFTKKNFRSLAVIEARIFMIYVCSKSRTKIGHKVGQGAVKRS